MSELVIRRLTSCPTGNVRDEKVLEIVLETDGTLPPRDPTPRTETVIRMFSRGDLTVLEAHGLTTCGYASLGFADFAVDGTHIESRVYEGATLDFWMRQDEQGRTIPFKESWTGIRAKDEKIEP
jgi:hypothetical protein